MVKMRESRRGGRIIGGRREVGGCNLRLQGKRGRGRRGRREMKKRSKDINFEKNVLNKILNKTDDKNKKKLHKYPHL